MVETLIAKLGGEKTLRQIIDVFIDRVFSDRMIGSFFRTANKSRIKEMEYQLTAEFLGGGVTYKGKPLDQAHAKRPIMNRDFMRRTQDPARDIGSLRRSQGSAQCLARAHREFNAR